MTEMIALPKDPTPEMLQAIEDHFRKWQRILPGITDDDVKADAWGALQAYRAMVEAAPKAQSPYVGDWEERARKAEAALALAAEDDAGREETNQLDATRESALAAALKLVLDDWANANSIGDDAREQAEAALNMPARSESSLGFGATCAQCGFRYAEHHGHILPCPRCAVDQLSSKLPRYLIYDVDKHQLSPRFTDDPSEHNGAPGNCDVLVDLHTGRRKWEGEWADIAVIKRSPEEPA